MSVLHTIKINGIVDPNIKILSLFLNFILFSLSFIHVTLRDWGNNDRMYAVCVFYLLCLLF